MAYPPFPRDDLQPDSHQYNGMNTALFIFNYNSTPLTRDDLQVHTDTMV